MSGAYYGPRPDVAALVPSEARVVWDVGCGTGLLGEALLRERAGLEVYGVEPSPEAAREAEGRLTGVAAERPTDGWPSPEVLVFADVLEHMVDPAAALGRYVPRLAPGGVVVASIPNILHFSVLQPLLLRGRWDYTDEGILDRTHLRFFTRDTALELLAGAGLEVLALHRNLTLPPKGWFRRLQRWAVWWDQRAGRPPGAIPPPGSSPIDLFTLQYLFVARRAGEGR